MLRFIIARDLCAVFKWSPLASCLANGQVNRICLPQSGICVQNVNFFTKSPYRKDVPFPNPRVSDGPADTLDLDKWKTVMRLKAAPVENAQSVDEDEDEEQTESNLTLDATRELVTMWRLAGKLMPQEISDEELQTLSELTTKSARKKYLKYLAIREGHKRSRKEKQQKKKSEREALLESKAKEEDEEGDDQKTLKNSLILQFWNRSLDKLLAWRSAQSMLFGQSLVFDLSYERNMSKREIENTVSQLIEVEAWNRRATDPYHLHYCNLQPDSYYKQQLIKRYGPETWDRLFISCTEKQHFEVFPREQLVYLTADSPNVLHKYDHNKVYIIGGMVDRSIQSGLSLANAKRLKLETARLPLDNYLQWDVGAKNLTLDQMIRILLTLKETGKWEEALQFVPNRKHDGFHSHQQTDRKSFTNKRENAFKSASISSKDLKLRNSDKRPLFNMPKILKVKTQRIKQSSKSGNWWNGE